MERKANDQRSMPLVWHFATTCSAVLLGFVLTIRLFAGRLENELPSRAHGLQELSSAGIGVACVILGALFWLAARRNRRRELDRYLLQAFLEHIPDNVFFKDRSSRFIRVSRGMARRFDVADPSELIGKTDSDFFSSEHAGQALADEQKILSTGEPLIGLEEKETWPDGREAWVLTTKVPLRDRAGRIIGTMGIARDITDRKQAEVRICHMALHDELTGLANRALLHDRLVQAIALATRNCKRVGVLMLDLDHFKSINDSLGHYVGDAMLQEVARRLTSCLRESDTVARVGGDEFVIAIPLANSSDEIMQAALRAQASLSRPFRIEGHEVHIAASIGICEYPSDGEQPDVLLQNADSAMYQAKTAGRGACLTFTPEMTEATRRRRKMQNDLRHALSRGEFSLNYQPLVCTHTGQINGVEALLRWHHPELGSIPPNQFIPQLEELGLMAEVGRWVLETACRQNAEWQKQGLAPVRVAVNLSAQQFGDGDLVRTVESILRETGLEARWLDLEITESLTMDESEVTVAAMRNLKKLGVSLSLDDFGTGWSSLGYLRRFQFDRIKIDRSFMRDLASQPTAETVVRSIINLGHNLGLTCIAEGVETPQQLEYLQKQMCPEMQGYLCSPALPPEKCADLLRTRTFGFSEHIPEAYEESENAADVSAAPLLN
jgi:diguanylate cyclase (GGDEF)-like protein/PAS domain S-box-containing protein